MAKKIIIIGGGIAGLSAGIYGQLNGFETEIFEMHNVPGGQCTAWERKGYRFDYCLHWLVGSVKGGFNQLWKELNVINKKTKIIDHEIFTKLTNENGKDFLIYTNINRWEKYLIELAPEDANCIRKMCRDMKKATKFDFPEVIKSFKDIGTRIMFYYHLLPVLPLFIKYGKKDCNSYFRELKFKNPELNYFLGRIFGMRDFSAIAFIMTLAWFDQKNAGYIIGGSKPLIEGMIDRYGSLGGKLSLGEKVTKIVTEKSKACGIILSDGTIYRADYVVGAADGYSTVFNMLDGKYVSKQIKEAYDNWELFTPIVQVSFGINDKIKAESPSQSFLTKDKKIGSTILTQGYSIMNYSFDPAMAPEGKTTIVMRYESPWEIWESMTDDAYKSEKVKIKEDAISLMEIRYPGITDKIDVVDVATPKTDVRFTGVWKGSYEGFLPTSKNITKGIKNTLPNLENFYLAGQWLTPGGGLPPSAMSGKKAIARICKNENKKFEVK